MTKLQISLTDEETILLAEKAALLGYDVTKYAKFVLAKEAVENTERIPTYKANARMEEAIREGREQYKKGSLRSWPL